LNPGLIAPEAFYNTYSPVQSKYSYAPKSVQFGNTFNAQQYNQAAAPATPFGLQNFTAPLTSAQIDDIIAGRPYTPAPGVPSATRREAYAPAPAVPAGLGYIPIAGNYRAPTAAASVTKVLNDPNATDEAKIAAVLGPNYAYDQQNALANGDQKTYWLIQDKIDRILAGTYKP